MQSGRQGPLLPSAGKKADGGPWELHGNQGITCLQGQLAVASWDFDSGGSGREAGAVQTPSSVHDGHKVQRSEPLGVQGKCEVPTGGDSDVLPGGPQGMILAVIPATYLSLGS